ncbi:MAG: hypothetical protein GY863_21595, partial [bacterium]|nr:hypothetical protein [bacterium]
NAYGVTIRRHIVKRTGKEYTYGTIYSILEQLLKKGYVDKNEGEPSSERGGRRKLMYDLTPVGVQALKNAYEMQQAVWGSVTGKTIDAENYK